MGKFSRREILRLTGLSAVGAFVLQACGYPKTELQVQSPVKMPEDVVTGRDTWYATICRECPAGCGTIVRVVEGRAIKIEGNPFHPLNRGKICPRGLAAVQALYHPDRLKKPLWREQRTGDFREIGWEEALGKVSKQLSQLRDQGQADTVMLVTPSLRGHAAAVTRHFIDSYGGQQMAYESLEDAVLRAALKQAFNAEILPDFDIASAGYVLSFGADFLSSWLSPVRYGMGYGEFRQGNRPRGTLVQIDPRFSLTAANADEWVAIKPGTEGALALSLAQVIISEGLGDSRAASSLTRGQGDRVLADFRPGVASRLTGVAEGKIREIARNFARPPGGGPSLAIAGGSAGAHSNGLDNMTAVFLLNYLAGSVGRPGGIVFNPPPPTEALGANVRAASFQEWQRLLGRMTTGQPRPVNTVLVYGANPAYGMPQSLDFPRALKAVPFVVSLASFLDETSAQADLVLPVHMALEEWGADIPEPGPGIQVVSYQQPVVNPVGESQSLADIVLQIGKSIGGDVAKAMPGSSSLEWLQNITQDLHKLGRGSVTAPDFPAFWNKLLQRGVWFDERAAGPAPGGPVPAFPKPDPADFSGTEADYPYYLVPFPSHSLGDGSSAHLPWLQATPDPLTTAVWRTWVEIGRETADSLVLAEGDVVEVSSPSGSVEATVYIHPILPAGVVSLPMGQGHALYTRYAQGRGANVAAVLAPVSERQTGALAWAATRVRLKKTSQKVRLPKFEGVVPAFPLPDAEIVQVTTASEAVVPGVPPAASRPHDRYRWAMVADLDRCTGCQACVVACQAENNLPLNQEDWFNQRRAFEWIRVERYWEGDRRARFIPVLCQHCTNAPCEPVCPVYATSHNEQGLNIQVYPRCIGTRFCANNCPYQVRFFNYWPVVWPQSLRNHLNPSVTVRPRGVIEKCTFCVQRINVAMRLARREGRGVEDGDIKPACVQACPTNALVFGNILDPASQVSRLAQSRRAYHLLEKLGTEPAVTYLKKVELHGA